MSDYQTFTADDARQFALSHSDTFRDSDKLEAEEFGDGNLNLVFRVKNQQGRSLIVKQALPYARCVGESWPLTIDRARIEAEVLLRHGRICPEHTVQVLHYDAAKAAILMEDLGQLTILRSELVAGKQFPRLASQMAQYLAHTLFHTSDFVLNGLQKKTEVARFLNPELCLITEDLFFTDPYCNHERNNIHQAILPQARELWHDEALQAEVARLKADFLSKPQALLHGDVHSGSIFIDAQQCKVIDAEFGFYGPIGFDVGSLIGNLLLNYAGQFGLQEDTTALEQQHRYLLEQIETLWQGFASEFSQLMQTQSKESSFANSSYQHFFLQQVLADSIGYAGCELIRRTVGLAHVADLEQIRNEQLRARSERLALMLGRQLIMQRHSLTTIQQLLTLVQHQELPA
ncbi:S-methyl-5-thioribose kinase [Alkalimonas mucilaginosa]|uniref:Methylthioribose kinase n=1 Tax=Alkalimonas mucilaginosa TaxID=3057676 RepID=A0ABU7JJ53_9GAMM|nr:S-methyl-5-thioribose kinase [Alkalimonas sp. MEB004]MEE2025520.1 S-methyl-5-thioribose kinase [Alkalimonas sp. MEB004]